MRGLDGYDTLIQRRLAARNEATSAVDRDRCAHALEVAVHLRDCPKPHSDRPDLVAMQLAKCAWGRE